MNVINDIKLFVKNGYSNDEIREILDVSDEEINNIRISYMRVNSPSKDKFSRTCINVFCKFLERGISNEQLYDLFRLRKKCKREEFYILCQNLREGKVYTDITSQYNIPMEPTVTLDLDKYKKSKSETSKSSNKDLYEEKREIARKKREKQQRLVNEAIERKEKEDKERVERKKKLAKIKAEKEKNKVVISVPKTEDITDLYKDEPLPVLDTTPSSVQSDDKINRVCSLLNLGYPYDEIQKVTSVPVLTISRIHNGEAFTDISAKYGIISKNNQDRMAKILEKIENDNSETN